VLIKSKVDTATRKRLSKFGAYVRQTARQSIRKRKGSSRPGQPPSSHTGLLKQFIYFGYDENRRSVVIGPVVLARKASGIPEVLEHGGNVTIQWGKNRGKTVSIEARPFMGPAFDAELEKQSSLWANSIR
jgi:phage gpG-like protein